MGLPLLTVNNLTVTTHDEQGKKTILNNVSFTLNPGEILSVIGESGAGKTVLAKTIVNWLPASLDVESGEVIYRGSNLLTDKKLANKLAGNDIAYVGGNPAGALDPTMTVGAQLVEKLRAVQPNVTLLDAKKRAIELLEAVRIPAAQRRFDEYPFQYSGGMMQRVMIVDALISEPALLVADNITQPLDVTVAAQILKLMRDLNVKFNTAILFICSSLPVACDAADNVLVLNKGSVVEVQSPKQLVTHPRHFYTRTLIRELPKLWHETDITPRSKPNDRPILSVRGVGKAYSVINRKGRKSSVQAVRNVDFDVYPGDNFALVGESGCGKSSLMRLLTGLEVPDQGEIIFDGESLTSGCTPARLRELRREFQLVLQDPYGSLPPQTSIGSILEEPLIIHKLGSRAERKEKALYVMNEVGLPTELYNQLPNGLSAGQRQRLNVARAMILQPKLLIMDETLSALDQTEQSKLLDLFDRLQQKHGFTYIYISHDLAMVRRVCSRIAVMYLGETVEVAPNQRLFFDPGHPYTKAMLSAAPTLEERKFKPQDCLLEGEPPSPIDLPIGCAFCSRCPNAMERCRNESPSLQARGSYALAACFLNDRNTSTTGNNLNFVSFEQRQKTALRD